LLRLPLAQAGIPAELHDRLAKLSAFWAELDAGGSIAETFAASPAVALQQAGLAGVIDPLDPVIDVIRLTVDPALRAKIQALNFKGYLKELQARGLMSRSSRSQFRREMGKILQRDFESFRVSFDSLMASAPHFSEYLERSDRVNALLASVGESNVGMRLGVPTETAATAAAVVVVAIAALVVTYVSVGVGVTVGITAGFSISIAVSMGVTVGGGPCRPPGCPRPAVGRAIELQRESRRAALVAQLLGRHDLAAETIRAEIDSQVFAITQAAQELQILRIPPARRADFDSRLRALAYETVGL
jgi:hypothetical protein